MITIFAIPKPFEGHFSIIQQNAINSWLKLNPKPEIILFGDEKGTEEICNKLGLIHIPEVKKNEYGTPLISDIFEQAQTVSGNNTLCYSNCDIFFSDDLIDSIEQAKKWNKRFLLIGKRIDLDVDCNIDFSDKDAVSKLLIRADSEGKIKPPNWIDYFIFSKGSILNILPFGVGRPGWDNWLLWYSSKHLGLKLIDASHSITAIHQNHDYSHHPDGFKGVWESEEAKKSYDMVGGRYHYFFISNASYKLVDGEIIRNITLEHISRLLLMNVFSRIKDIWFNILRITRPIRHRLGIKNAQH
jgi:hypothetical protein